MNAGFNVWVEINPIFFSKQEVCDLIEETLQGAHGLSNIIVQVVEDVVEEGGEGST